MRIPLTLANQVTPAPFSWQVPGFRAELATELLRTLPKATRRLFVPAPEYARRALAWLTEHPGDDSETLSAGLGRALRSLVGELVPVDQWRLGDVPDHLQVHFEVVDAERGTPLAAGRDLAELKRALTGDLSRTLASAAPSLTRTGAVDWVFGQIPDRIEIRRDGRSVVGYPALADEGSTVGLTLFDSPERQGTQHPDGVRRLVLLNTPDPTKWVVSRLGNLAKLALAGSPYAGVPDLLADARLASVGELSRRRDGGSVRDEEGFRALCDAVRAENPELMRGVVDLAAEIVTARGEAQAELARVRAVSEPAYEDLTEQLGNLVFDRFLSATAYERLVDLPRYLRAAQVRVRNLLAAPARDRAGLETMLRCEEAYAVLCAEAPPGRLPDFVDEIGWMLEELRVSLFAQPLRTRLPVSEKRVMTAVGQAHARLRG